MTNPELNEQLKRYGGDTLRISSGDELQRGQLVGGRYEVLSRLGKGGMGLVYRVNQILLNKEFALKTIDKSRISEIAIQRFQQEARTTFALDHPNIIAVNEFGLWEDQTPFLVMELLNGETLGERTKRTGCLTLEEAIPIFVQVCFGLAYAHECGIVHRDIKPNNIMILNGLPLGAEGSVKILDFGIAKFTSHEGGEVQALTRTGEIFGSPLYMSPEQCSGFKVDHRADVYALGCVLFEALTGTPPFMGDNALSTMMKHQGDKAPTLKEASLGADFPQAIENIVAKMLAKEPENRYQNLGIAAHDLGAFKRGAAISATARHTGDQAKAEATANSISRNTFYAWLAGAVVVSMALGGVAGYKLRDFQSQRTVKPDADATLRRTDTGISSVIESTPELMNPVVSEKDLEEKLKYQSKEGFRFSVGGGKTVTAKTLELISNAKWIKELDLHDCVISNEGLISLAKLPMLSTVGFSSSTLNNTGVEALSHCKAIKEINANRTQLTDNEIVKLGAIKGLQTLDLVQTGLTDDGLAALARSARSLAKLEINGVKTITSKGLIALENTNLQVLCLDSTPIDDSGMPYLAKIKSLKTVYLNQTIVTVKGIETLIKNSKSCRTVTLLDCPKIKQKELRQLRREFPEATFISNYP